MRAFLAFCLAVAFTLPMAAETLKVMAYNIRYPEKRDGVNYWDERRPVAIEMLRRAAPDLIGTQELFFRQGEDIVTALPEYVWLGTARYGIHTNEYMGIFFRKDRFELLQMGQFWLSETPDVPGSMSWNVNLPRLATWVRLLDKRTGKPLYFIDTHFAHRGEDADARAKSAQVITKFLATLPADIPVLLVGDFNTGPDTEAHRAITASMKDAWLAAKQRKGPEGTFHGFRGGDGGGPSRRIDWVLFRAPFTVIEAETIVMRQGDQYPSDHYPVMATFALP
ncbi:MAG: endonuclease/exonuclease/phosphatase family protein [Bryobacterales bacterium]|nr:endonuclease/exonuclease/phosphatase family protein [Bryobacterales bacterium]